MKYINEFKKFIMPNQDSSFFTYQSLSQLQPSSIYGFWQLQSPLLSYLALFPTAFSNNELCVISVCLNQLVSLMNWEWPQEQTASLPNEEVLKQAKLWTEF